MTSPFNTLTVPDAVRAAIEAAISGSVAEVSSRRPGHLSIRVTAPAFAGQPLLAQQRLVYRAITPLMTGPDAPVHAIDRLETSVPPKPL